MPNPLWQLILFIHRSGSLIVRDMYSVILNLSLVFVSGLLAGFVYLKINYLFTFNLNKYHVYIYLRE